MNEIENQIVEIISDQSPNGEEIKPSDRLEEDLQIDSLDRVEVAMGLEDKFGIDVPDPKLEGWKTVQDVIDTVKELKG